MNNLVVFSNKLFRFSSDHVKTSGSFTIQMDAIAPFFDEIILCTPTEVDHEFNGISITSSNISYSPLPNFAGRIGFILSLPRIIKRINANIKLADLSLIILPSYVGVVASIICQLKKVPIFQWVISDWGKNVVARRHSRMTQLLAAKFIKPILDWLICQLTNDVLTFYNGSIPFNHQKPYHYTRISSSIQEENLYVQNNDTSLVPPVSFLFVGRLSLEKGLSCLLEAFTSFLAEGIDAVLHIAGSGELEKNIKLQIADLSIGHKVIYHGFIPHDNKLRELYRKCDLLIVPSLQDQSPKVILEGMANGIPVIATNVGAIPQIIQNGVNGLLIPPAQPEAINTMINRVISDNELRYRLIQKGFEYASAHTVEKETTRMMQIVSVFFRDEVLDND